MCLACFWNSSSSVLVVIFCIGNIGSLGYWVVVVVGVFGWRLQRFVVLLRHRCVQVRVGSETESKNHWLVRGSSRVGRLCW